MQALSAQQLRSFERLCPAESCCTNSFGVESLAGFSCSGRNMFYIIAYLRAVWQAILVFPVWSPLFCLLYLRCFYLQLPTFRARTGRCQLTGLSASVPAMASYLKLILPA